jgi:glycerol uptake facilitator-like aquaporin
MVSLFAVYITANVSGGHLNPAVTFATCLTGHTSWAKGGLYVIAQVLGGIFGSLMGVSQLVHLWLYLCQCIYLAINVITICQFCTRFAI